MVINVFWSFIVLGLQLLEATTNTTQVQNHTSILKSRRQLDLEQLTPPPRNGNPVRANTLRPKGLFPGDRVLNIQELQSRLKQLARQGNGPQGPGGEPFGSTVTRFQRTTPSRVSFIEDCDYLAHYCLKAYDTGALCGRTLYYRYYNFKNYCLLDYVNCMERYEVWQVAHMGECFTIKVLSEYIVYPYEDDYFLDQYYVIEDN